MLLMGVDKLLINNCRTPAVGRLGTHYYYYYYYYYCYYYYYYYYHHYYYY